MEKLKEGSSNIGINHSIDTTETKEEIHQIIEGYRNEEIIEQISKLHYEDLGEFLVYLSLAISKREISHFLEKKSFFDCIRMASEHILIAQDFSPTRTDKQNSNSKYTSEIITKYGGTSDLIEKISYLPLWDLAQFFYLLGLKIQKDEKAALGNEKIELVQELNKASNYLFSISFLIIN